MSQSNYIYTNTASGSFNSSNFNKAIKNEISFKLFQVGIEMVNVYIVSLEKNILTD